MSYVPPSPYEQLRRELDTLDSYIRELPWWDRILSELLTRSSLTAQIMKRYEIQKEIEAYLKERPRT